MVRRESRVKIPAPRVTCNYELTITFLRVQLQTLTGRIAFQICSTQHFSDSFFTNALAAIPEAAMENEPKSCRRFLKVCSSEFCGKGYFGGCVRPFENVE